MAALADYHFAVESRDTARIQEAHILAGHMLCDWVELDAMGGAAGRGVGRDSDVAALAEETR
jgi:D-sedoheptulose 7-phosphate isomerase